MSASLGLNFQRWQQRASSWRKRHPLIWQALLWCLPAVVFGAALRLAFLSYSPLAYWGSDSNSYFSFAEQLLQSGKISLYDKRRYFYPIFLLPVSALPGATLRWLVWIQHGFGLLTLWPLAYAVRKCFTHWRWIIIPVTVAYAGLPIVLWYEHELLAETFFFAFVVWSMAGWMAWEGARGTARGTRLWWCFFVPFALLVLTKPAGRFSWPGVLLALVATRAWQVLRGREWVALGVAAALTLTIGQDSQGSWLLYTSAFPLTRLETPLHAEYKAEVRDLVERARQHVREFRMDDNRAWKGFLKNPEEQSERPLWQALGRDVKRRTKVYKELALEGIKHRPDLFLLIAGQRIMSSANPDDFKAERFTPDYIPRKFQHLYERYAEQAPHRNRLILGLSQREPLPTYEVIQQKLNPHPDSAVAGWLSLYVTAYQQWIQLEHDASDQGNAGTADTPTLLGWWVILGALASLLPGYFRRLGVWTIIISGYLFGVFLVGGANARFFAAAWPVLALLAGLPIDALARIVSAFRARLRVEKAMEAA